jgi:DNA-binding transcriptional MocR family regulator
VQKLTCVGVEVQALSRYYAGRKKRRGLLLSFAGFTEKDLTAAAKILIAAL